MARLTSASTGPAKGGPVMRQSLGPSINGQLQMTFEDVKFLIEVILVRRHLSLRH